MSLFDTKVMIENLYSSRYNSAELVSNIDGICSSGEVAVRVIPFSSDKNPVELFTKRRIGKRKISLSWQNSDVSQFTLTCAYKQNNIEETIQGVFFLVTLQDTPGSYVAITLEDSNFFKRGLLGFLEGLYPHISFTFLSHKKYKEMLLATIKKGNLNKVWINRASVKFRFQSQDDNRRKMSAVIWPSMTLEEAFDWVQENNSFFYSLNLRVELNYGYEYSVSYTRRGILTTGRQFKLFYEFLALPICELVSSNRKFFGHRGREDTANREVKPLMIDFPFEPFRDKNENHRFIESVEQLSNASVSVIHGNPYIHLSVVDYCDGSTYDLWVLSAGRLILTPQLTGTVESIGRIVSHIFDTFAEGKIRDYAEVSNG